jgi:NTE family protein
MSIPLVFPPVEWEGRRLVDGLIVNNLPADLAREFGAPVLVAVDASSPPLEGDAYESALGVANQVSDLLTRRRYRDFAVQADVVIRPELGRHSATDYADFDELIRAGYLAAQAAVPAIREKLASAGVVDLAPRRAEAKGPALENAAIASVRVEGNHKVSERLARRTFNVPVGPPYSMQRGLRAFDKIDASPLFERTWLEFHPAPAGVDVVLRVKEAPANRAEANLGFTEWEQARGAIRLRNQNTFGFGEEVGLLLAASDAEQRVELSLRGERLLVVGLGHRVTGYWNQDKPRFFTEDGDEINRADYDRSGVEAALHSSLERWGFLEAGARFGRVKTRPRAGLPFPEASDGVNSLFAQAAFDTLDDRSWPEHGQRLAVAGDWSLADLGADHEYWRLWLEGRAARRLGSRLVLQADGVTGVSGRDLPIYDWFRLGGPDWIPGYRHEELKGTHAFAAALSLRFRLVGNLRVLGRAGAGNAFERHEDVTLSGLRWGVGVGLYHPSQIGPVAVELGVRDGGATLVSLSVGWN